MASAEEFARWIVENQAKKGTPEFETVSRAYQLLRQQEQQPGGKDYRALAKPEAVDPTEGMSQLQRFNAGAGKALYDIGQGAAQMVGLGESGEETKARRELDRPLMNTAAGLAGNVTGNVAALAPAAVIPGAATLGGAAAIGAGIGALQPATQTQERLRQMFEGGALGASSYGAQYLPDIGQRVREVGRAVVEPFTGRGQEQILGRFLKKMTGGEHKEVAARLLAYKPKVSELTTGQIAENAPLAALERTAVATDPATMQAHQTLMNEQNRLRIEALRKMAGEGGIYESAVQRRDLRADRLYGRARALGVDPEQAEMLQPQIKNLMERIPGDVLREARAIARASGENTAIAEGSLNGLHYVKKGLDSLLEKKGTDALSGTKRAVYAQLRDDFLTVLDDLSPAYAKARGEYAKASGPINQMEIARALLERGTNSLSGRLQAAAFARQMENPHLAPSATGFSGATMERTMSPQQMQTLGDIREELRLAQGAQNLGRGPGSDTVQKLAVANLISETGIPSVPMLFSRPWTISKALIERAYAGPSERMAARLRNALLHNPQEVAGLIQGVKPPQTATLTPEQRERIALLLRSSAMPAIPYLGGE